MVARISGVILIALVLFGLIYLAVQLGLLKDPAAITVSIFVVIVTITFGIFNYSITKQQAEKSSWNTALLRIGQLYDQAIVHKELAEIIFEPVDLDGSVTSRYIQDGSKQAVWLSNFFMALEQVFVAMSGAGGESRRAWQRYLANQLNKPTIRAVFLADVEYFSDYHQDFIDFALGKAIKTGGVNQYSGGAIKKEVLNSILKKRPPKVLSAPVTDDLKEYSLTREYLGFWKEMYSDPEVKRQMYAVPSLTDEQYIEYFNDQHNAIAYVVLKGDKPVAGFTLRRLSQTMATFGLIVHSSCRGLGLGNCVMKILEKRAAAWGILTLRADVYEDNSPSRRVLEKSGFRAFSWFEKNIN